MPELFTLPIKFMLKNILTKINQTTKKKKSRIINYRENLIHIIKVLFKLTLNSIIVGCPP